MAELPDEYLGKSPNSFKRMRESLGSDPVGNIDIKWKGRLVQIPVYRISIKDLRYNLFNTRIKPHLLQNIAEHSRKDDYFHTEVDKDSLSTQKMINGFLRKNHDRKDALNHFKNPKNEPIVQEPRSPHLMAGYSMETSVFVFSESYFSNMTKYEKLQQTYVAFLPDNGTAEDERELEATFQETKLAAVPFNWYNQDFEPLEEMKKGRHHNKSARPLVYPSKMYDSRSREFNSLKSSLTTWESKLLARITRNESQTHSRLSLNNWIAKDRDKREMLKDMTFKILTDPQYPEVGKTVHVLIGEAAKNIDSFEVSSEDGWQDYRELDDDLLKPRAKKSKKCRRQED